MVCCGFVQGAPASVKIGEYPSNAGFGWRSLVPPLGGLPYYLQLSAMLSWVPRKKKRNRMRKIRLPMVEKLKHEH